MFMILTQSTSHGSEDHKKDNLDQFLPHPLHSGHCQAELHQQPQASHACMDRLQNRVDFVYNKKLNNKFMQKDVMLPFVKTIRYQLATWYVSIVASRAAPMNVKNVMFTFVISALSSMPNFASIALPKDLMEIPERMILAQVPPQLVVLET
jgi:hypothetical protein